MLEEAVFRSTVDAADEEMPGESCQICLVRASHPSPCAQHALCMRMRTHAHTRVHLLQSQRVRAPVAHRALAWGQTCCCAPVAARRARQVAAPRTLIAFARAASRRRSCIPTRCVLSRCVLARCVLPLRVCRHPTHSALIARLSPLAWRVSCGALQMRRAEKLLRKARHECPLCKSELRGSSLRSPDACYGLQKVPGTWQEEAKARPAGRRSLATLQGPNESRSELEREPAQVCMTSARTPTCASATRCRM